MLYHNILWFRVISCSRDLTKYCLINEYSRPYLQDNTERYKSPIVSMRIIKLIACLAFTSNNKPGLNTLNCDKLRAIYLSEGGAYIILVYRHFQLVLWIWYDLSHRLFNKLDKQCLCHVKQTDTVTEALKCQ